MRFDELPQLPHGIGPGWYYKEIGDERYVAVVPMTFGKARLIIGTCGDDGAEDGYCYESPHLAVLAAQLWDGEGDPLVGWHRHLGSGRRRPGGDPTKEVRYA